MKTLGLFEAKQKLSEVVDRARRGERIGITRRGKLAAVIGPPQATTPDVAAIFASIDEIKSKMRLSRKKISIKSLIEEGRE
jgi:prevent-host-death family protein